MKKKISIIILSVLIILLSSGFTTVKPENQYQNPVWNFKDIQKIKEGPFTYYIYPSWDEEKAWIYGIKIKKNKECSTLKIPEVLDGKDVVRLGWTHEPFAELEEIGQYSSSEFESNIFFSCIEAYHENDGGTNETKKIKKLEIPKTVEEIEYGTFSGMDSITEVRLPPKVKEIKGLVFWGCDNLKKIYFEGNLKEFDNRALQGCLNLEEIKLSKRNKTFQMKNECMINKKEKSLVYALSNEKALNIPNGIKSIKTYAFNNCRTKMINIPSSVKHIESDAFGRYYLDGNKDIKNITVSKKNRVYAKDGQCIYNKKDKTLVAAIVDSNGELKVSNKIRYLTDIYSMINYDALNYNKVVFQKNLKCVTVPAFYRVGHAKKVYYTGAKPPEIKNRISGYASLPIYVEIYVPKKYLDIYQEWYKKYKCYSGNKWRVY